MAGVVASGASLFLGADFVSRAVPLGGRGAPSALPPEPLPFTSASLPRPPFSAKRKDEASHGPSREDEKASWRYHNSTEKRHAEVTNGRSTRHLLEIGPVLLLGIWSRIEMLTFVAILVLVALVIMRRTALRLAINYAAAAIVVTGSLLVVYRLEDVDRSQTGVSTAHPFLTGPPHSRRTPPSQPAPHADL